MTTSMAIEFGTLHDVVGQAASHGGFTFVPALVELNGSSFSTEFHLKDSVGERPPPVLARPLAEKYDAAWVRGRLPRIFGFSPAVAEVEKSLLDVGFVAVETGRATGFPFVVADSYGRTGLMSSPDGPPSATQARIAAAFWSLLLQSPEDLDDFEEKVFHPGAGVWMHFACEAGQVLYDESEEGE